MGVATPRLARVLMFGSRRAGPPSCCDGIGTGRVEVGYPGLGIESVSGSGEDPLHEFIDAETERSAEAGDSEELGRDAAGCLKLADGLRGEAGSPREGLTCEAGGLAPSSQFGAQFCG